MTKIDRDITHSIILNKEDFKDLFNVAESQYTKLEVMINCVEGSELTYYKGEDFLSYENQTSRKITSVKISAGEPFSTGGFRLTIRKSQFANANIYLTDVDDIKALHTANRIEDIFRECKPWYSRFKSRNFYFACVLLLFLALLSFGIYAVLSYSFGNIDAKTFAKSSTVTVIASISLVLFMYAGDFLNWCFPSLWFNLGRQEKEFERRKQVVSFIFVTIVLAVVINVVTALLMK